MRKGQGQSDLVWSHVGIATSRNDGLESRALSAEGGTSHTSTQHVASSIWEAIEKLRIGVGVEGLRCWRWLKVKFATRRRKLREIPALVPP